MSATETGSAMLDTLQQRLTEPSDALIADLAQLQGDLVVVGAAGKLGPSLVGLATRALRAAGNPARVYAVSRFSDPTSAEVIDTAGGVPVPADISDPRALADLPDAPNVVYLVGAKFGSTGAEANTWYTNAFLPGIVAHRYPGARFSALSTGNVYPFTAPGSEPTEDDPLGPVGEYAMSCLGRERVLEAATARTGSPLSLIRLNYAVEMRYGVLVDLASAILAGDPIDVSTGYVNIVWQGFANEVTLRALLHAGTPPVALNVTGTQTLAVRDLATDLAARLDREVGFTGTEAPTALLSDASRCAELFGEPAIDVSELIELTAQWLGDGGPVHGKPTGFQRRDGKF